MLYTFYTTWYIPEYQGIVHRGNAEWMRKETT